MTSSHSATSPNRLPPRTCSAPVRSACWLEWPKAIWTAIQPMIMYITPRAVRPARARNRMTGLFAARRPEFLTVRACRPAAEVTTVYLPWTPPEMPVIAQSKQTSSNQRGIGGRYGPVMRRESAGLERWDHEFAGIDALSRGQGSGDVLPSVAGP